MIPITPDSNLVVSGFVRPDRPPGRLVSAWRRKQVQFVLSEVLLSEVHHTFLKPYFRRTFSIDQVRENMEILQRAAFITSITESVRGIATHPEDDAVLATALSGGSQFLVTGDHKLLALHDYRGVLIVSVQQFLGMLPGLSGATPLS